MAKYKIIPSSRTIVRSPISIGHKAEKGVQAIEFDLTAWVDTYGSGTLTVIMRRWGDAIPYPIALEIDENNKATWTLSDMDTAKAGMAYAQLSYIVGDEVVKKSDIYTFRVMDSLTGEGEPPEAYESWLEHLQRLAAEAMAEVLDIEGIVTDKTLTVDGGIADAKKTGDEIAALKADLEDLDERLDSLGDGVPTEVRQAILTLFQSAAYAETGLTNEVAVIASWAAVVTAISLNQSSISISGASTNQLVATTTPAGGTVIWASSDASVATVSSSGLVTGVGNGSCTITASCGGKNATCSVTVSGFATLSSISAVYTQSGTVYETDTLNSLKSDLVVVASYSDGTTRTLSDSDYALSGTLEFGTSTIVVSYGGKIATFNVNVSVVYKMTDGDFIKVNTGFVYNAANKYLYLTTNQSNVRRSFVSATGTTKLMQSSDDTNFTESEYYPIKIPRGTNTVTVSITPSARYVGISAFSLNNGEYETLEGTTSTGWQMGQCSLAIPNSDNAYLNCASKYASAGSAAYSQEPTEVTITFSR